MTYFDWLGLSAAERFATLECMEDFGGTFVHDLAHLYQVADVDNAEKLFNAFPEIFDKYQPKRWNR